MINKIFFDLDHTLISSTLFLEDGQVSDFQFELTDGPYFTDVREKALDILEYSRKLVGEDNVFILTAAFRDYALAINEKGCLGFRPDQIYTREDTDRNLVATAYNGSYTCENPSLVSRNNVLIDDLTPRFNQSKISYIGLSDPARYIRPMPFCGHSESDDPLAFFEMIEYNLGLFV